MFEMEPVILLLLYGIIHYLLMRLGKLPLLLTQSLAVLFWMTLGIYWGLYLAVLDTLAPWLCFVFGILLIQQMPQARNTNWFNATHQGLLVMLTMGALIIDSIAFWQRYDLFVVAVTSWYLLAIGMPILELEWNKGRCLEGLLKSLLNSFAGFVFLFLGQSLLVASQAGVAGPIFHSGWGLVGSIFFLLGWVWMVGLWPLQTWLTDELESQPVDNLFFYLIIRAGIFFWMCRMWLTDFPEITVFSQVLLILGLAGFVWSVLLSLMQTNLQRLLAYTLQSLWSIVVVWVAFVGKGQVTIDWSSMTLWGLAIYSLMVLFISHSYLDIYRYISYTPIISDFRSGALVASGSARNFLLVLFGIWTSSFALGLMALFSMLSLSAWGLAAILGLALLLGLYASWKTTISVILEGFRHQA